MKKMLLILVTLVIILAIIGGCVCWYKSATKVDISIEDSSEIVEDEEYEKMQEPTEALFSQEDYPRVDASLAIHPLVDEIASDFLQIPVEDLKYEYTKTRTSDVYKNLVDGKADVIFVAEPSTQDYEYAKSNNVELNVIPVTSSAFVFVVNTENPVNNLTLDEIVKIYKGEITNWKEVGGNDEEIIAYQRPDGSGSQTAMISLVMKEEKFTSAPQIKVAVGMEDLVDAIAEYDNSKAALGYSYFYYINTMYKRDTVKMLAVNGINPTIETIKNGTYPIYTNGYIVTRKDLDENSSAKKWVDNVLSQRGSKIIEDAGYVPVN